jgi:hypothetical protein
LLTDQGFNLIPHCLAASGILKTGCEAMYCRKAYDTEKAMFAPADLSRHISDNPTQDGRETIPANSRRLSCVRSLITEPFGSKLLPSVPILEVFARIANGPKATGMLILPGFADMLSDEG